MSKQLLIIFALVIFSSFVTAQIFVSPGEATLSAALEEAEDGDVFQLVPDALYTESTKFEFATLVNKNVTIEVEGDGSVKAIIRMLTPATTEDTPNFFLVGDAASLTLRGLELDGSQSGVPVADYLMNMYMGEFPAPTNVNTLRIENCFIHDLASDIIAAGNSEMKGNVIIDSTFIDNVVTENTATIIYFKYAGSHFISLTNSTFNEVTSYGMRIAGSGENLLPDHHPTVIVDHTTWYNIGTLDGREILQAEKEPTLFKNPWFVTNSIFVKQVDQNRTMINIKDTFGDSLATITNIAFWDIGNINFRLHTVKDTIRMDPEFADPDNGDFTLPVGSLLLSYGTIGDAIGDPRWAENSTAVSHETGTVVKTFALDQNYPNPFNPTTRISFTLEKTGQTMIKIFDILGREIAVLVNRNLSAGTHDISFDAGHLNAGVYFYRLQSEGQSMTRKMILIK